MRLRGGRCLSFAAGWTRHRLSEVPLSYNCGTANTNVVDAPLDRPTSSLLRPVLRSAAGMAPAPRRRGGGSLQPKPGPRTKRRASRAARNRDVDGGEVPASASATTSAKKARGAHVRSSNASKDDAAEIVAGKAHLNRKQAAPQSDETGLLFSLNEIGSNDNVDGSNDLVAATLVSRPSKRNRSPYVADIFVPSLDREAVCHVPNLDMGGKCRPGVALLVRHARDRNGRVVGPDATSPKFGTPKCEFILQLLHVDESSFVGSDASSPAPPTTMYPPVWVGAHPALGERIAKAWIERNLLASRWGGSAVVAHVQCQVTLPEAPGRRFDFMVTHKDGTRRIVEVKTVVDCDYSSEAPPPPELIKCRYLTDSQPSYARTAIFPWGSRKQKGGRDGRTPVVSARAIHHVDELRRLVSEHNYQATVLFAVVRDDAAAFRPNREACPEFVRALRRAQRAGVMVVAKRARFGTRAEAATDELDNDDNRTDSATFASTIRNPENCYSDIDLPIQWPVDVDDDEDCT